MTPSHVHRAPRPRPRRLGATLFASALFSLGALVASVQQPRSLVAPPAAAAPRPATSDGGGGGGTGGGCDGHGASPICETCSGHRCKTVCVGDKSCFTTHSGGHFISCIGNGGCASKKLGALP